MLDLPVGVAIPKAAKLLSIEAKYGPFKDMLRCGLCGTPHGIGYIVCFETDGARDRGLLGHVCGRKTFGVAYSDAERSFEIAQLAEDRKAALERFHERAARILPELNTVLPHLRWQNSLRVAIERSAPLVVREASNAARGAAVMVAGGKFWREYLALHRAQELKREIESFQTYLDDGVTRRDFAHRLGRMVDIEHRWGLIAAASADADQALKPGNLDKLFKAANQLRKQNPTEWDWLISGSKTEDWVLNVRISGTRLERIPGPEEGRKDGWIVETDLAAGRHP